MTPGEQDRQIAWAYALAEFEELAAHWDRIPADIDDLAAYTKEKS
jgi:hypothetical protein